MADASDGPGPFDVRTIRYLVRLMSRHDLGEIDLAEGDRRIRLRKGPRLAAVAPANPAAPPPLATPTAPPPAASAEKAAPPARKLHEVKSTLVGTFYAQPKPDKPPFVRVGSKINVGDPLCVIMAMKVENTIESDIAGTIAEVCVSNEDFVEYNTVLFRVETGQ